MHTKKISDAPANARGGQISYLLLGPDEPQGRALAVTWVEGAPGSRQLAHRHPDSQQVYVMVAGRGLMYVGEESRTVDRGTLVVVPPGTDHCIENVGAETLVYVSATVPPFEMPAAGSGFAYSRG